jgi:hypothetical protein
MSQIVEAFIRWYSGAARYDPLATHRHWPPMTAALALLYNSAIIIVGAFLFVAVDWFGTKPPPSSRLQVRNPRGGRSGHSEALVALTPPAIGRSNKIACDCSAKMRRPVQLKLRGRP